MKKKRVFLVLFVVIFLVSLCFGVIYLKSVYQYKQSVKELSFTEPDVKQIPDGTYVGECDVDFVYAKVEVILEQGEIASVKLLEHKNERGKSAEIIPDKIVREQKIDVDTVSGATNSSKVIKKAVENALSQEVNTRR